MRAGEFDSLPPQRVWVQIDGYFEREQAEWERTRAICYNVARFGNSDPKRFPRSFQKFWPLPWDQKDKGPTEVERILSSHARMVERRKQFENDVK